MTRTPWAAPSCCRHCFKRTQGVDILALVHEEGPGYAGALCDINLGALQATVGEIECECLPGITAWCPVCHVVGIHVEPLLAHGTPTGWQVVEHVMHLSRLHRLHRLIPHGTPSA